MASGVQPRRRIGRPDAVDPPAIDEGVVATALAEINDRGYTVVRGLLPREAAYDAAGTLSDLQLGKGAGGDSSCLANLARGDWDPFITRATHPLVLAIAKGMLGSGIKMIGDIGRLLARPGEEAGRFHSDLPVSGWWDKNGRPYPSDCPSVQTIWALTDFTADNGATGVVPFSHTAGHPPRTDTDYEPYEKALEMPAGSVAVVHCATWHRKRRNATSKDRIGLSIPYVAQWLDPTTTWAIRMPVRVWRDMPASMRELNPHTQAESNAPRYEDAY